MKKKMYRYEVIADECSRGGECLSDEEYSSRAPQYLTQVINGIRYTETEYGGDVAFPEFLEPEDTVLLLSVVYTTGDSFGYTSGRRQYIALYSNNEEGKRLANKARKKIIEHADQYAKNSSSRLNNEDYSVSIPVETGANQYTDIQVAASWNGYFESLEDVEIDLVEVLR